MDSSFHQTHRVLAVLGGSGTGAAYSPGSSTAAFRILQETAARQTQESGIHAQVLEQPSRDQLLESIQQFQPTLLYLCQQAQQEILTAGPEVFQTWQDVGLLTAVCECLEAPASPGGTEAVYVDAVISEEAGQDLDKLALKFLIQYSNQQPVKQLLADQFGQVFFAALQCPVGTVPEAFALASHACHVHLGTRPGQALDSSPLPSLKSPDEANLPIQNLIPLPQLEGRDLPDGVAAAVPDWDDVRLLAPHAELRLLACGQPSLISPHRLTHLGEALRALLVLEVRRLKVTSQRPTHRVPAHLSPDCSAVCCEFSTPSGAIAQVVLGGPPEVLNIPSLVEYALRQTLVADALSLQFKLPPAGVPWPGGHTNPEIAWGIPLVHSLVVTSVWVIQILRCLCQKAEYRVLASIGVAAVGCTTVAGMTQTDAERLKALNSLSPSAPDYLEPLQLPADLDSQLLMQPPLPIVGVPQANPALDVLSQDQLALEFERQRERGSAKPVSSRPLPTGAGRGRPRKEPKLSIDPEIAKQPWTSDRAPLHICSKEELIDDIRRFLEHRKGKVLLPSTFPEAVLNGRQLDIDAMYRIVCHRGGFAADNTMNWAGKVFPAMANWANTHKMTGVGNALKRHYQALLLEYELANPQDVTHQELSA